jgi:hypothetical protein
MSTPNSTTGNDPRQQRGLQIASKYNLRQKGNVWIVPRQSVEHQYHVDPAAGTCTCPDHEIRRLRCKHIWAVEFQMCQEVKPDGTRTVTKTVRVTYAQNWPAYNAAQTTERDTFLTLLHDLCSGIDEPAQTFGRPRLRMADMVFASVFKVYSTVSGRRFMCDLADARMAQRGEFPTVRIGTAVGVPVSALERWLAGQIAGHGGALPASISCTCKPAPRLAELEGRRAVSAQFEPMAEKVKEYCDLIRHRLDQMTFEQKREVLEVLQAEFTLEKSGQLRILLVLPSAADISLYTKVRHACIHGARTYTGWDCAKYDGPTGTRCSDWHTTPRRFRLQLRPLPRIAVQRRALSH